MYQQVTSTCTTSYTELQRTSSIRLYMTVDATKTLTSAFILSILEMLCSQEYHNCFWTDGRELITLLLNSQFKLQSQTILLPFCTHSTGCQCLLEYDTKYPPFVTIPYQILVLSTCSKSCRFEHHQDNSVRPVTTTFLVYPLSKRKHSIKDPFHKQAQ